MNTETRVQPTQGELVAIEGKVKVKGQFTLFVPGILMDEGQAKANAEHIVRCWNEYDELKRDNAVLLEALRVVRSHIEQTDTDFLYNGIIIPKSDLLKYVSIIITERL